jgi:hypothetical protein
MKDVKEDNGEIADKSAKTFEEFREVGLLWALNRYLLHPRGYAIAFHFDKPFNEVIGWELLGDGSEVWAFDEETDDSGFDRFTAFLKGE